jgi:chromosome segregation ATPase
MFISRRAELETEVETRDREIGDFHSVIRNNEMELAEMEARIRDVQQENRRLRGLRQTVDNDYRDQIAILQMELSREIGSRRTKIEEAKQRLELQRKAKKISSTSLGESLELLQSRSGELCEKLGRAHAVAMQFRDEILMRDDEATAAETEITKARLEIEGLKRECDALVHKEGEEHKAIGQCIDSLNQQYQEVMHELEQAAKVIEKYSGELIDQDGRIDILTRELALSQQRYRTTLSAFQQDEEVAV